MMFLPRARREEDDGRLPSDAAAGGGKLCDKRTLKWMFRMGMRRLAPGEIDHTDEG
jgi:hypothetical protein